VKRRRRSLNVRRAVVADELPVLDKRNIEHSVKIKERLSRRLGG
jgi:hypothetical protein